MYIIVVFNIYGEHRNINVPTNVFPTHRSSEISAMSVFSVARGCEGFQLRVYGDGPVLSDVKRYFRPDAESGQAAWALPGNDMRTISPRGVRSRSSISPPWPLTTSRAIDSPRPNPLR